jgi:hypothetical protein
MLITELYNQDMEQSIHNKIVNVMNYINFVEILPFFILIASLSLYAIKDKDKKKNVIIFILAIWGVLLQIGFYILVTR